MSDTELLNILIVEDDDSDAALMQAELRRTRRVGEIVRVQTEADFRRELARGRLPDAILSDYTLPTFGARRALEICEELALDVPFIVVTGSISEEVAVDCMKRGASDYLLKDRLTRLGTALEQAVTAKAVRDQKMRAERARDSAMRELDHRVRNNLAVVVGLIELTARSVSNLDGFTPAIMGRVRALANVHDALREQHWLSADLGTLVSRIVQHLGELTQGRLVVSGEHVLLPARAVQAVGLALHELAQNAIRHGAWSHEGGLVEISWVKQPDDTVRLMWREAAAALSTTTPPEGGRREGVGLTLARNLIAGEAAGRLDVAFPPSGMTAELIIPLTHDE